MPVRIIGLATPLWDGDLAVEAVIDGQPEQFSLTPGVDPSDPGVQRRGTMPTLEAGAIWRARGESLPIEGAVYPMAWQSLDRNRQVSIEAGIRLGHRGQLSEGQVQSDDQLLFRVSARLVVGGQPTNEARVEVAILARDLAAVQQRLQIEPADRVLKALGVATTMYEADGRPTADAPSPLRKALHESQDLLYRLIVQIDPQWTAQLAASAGLEELRRVVGLEEWLGEIDWSAWQALTNPDTQLIQSPSGVRAIVGRAIPIPVQEPLEVLEQEATEKFSAAHRLIVARYAYQYATYQITKLQKANPQRREFTFVIGRDPRPSGLAIREAQIRGWLVAAEELGVSLKVLDVGILPTPFIQSAVRALTADGAVIITASHNPLEWGGFKYTTAAHEPAGAPFEGGALLPARDMTPIIEAFQQWAVTAVQYSAETPVFVDHLNRVDSQSAVVPADLRRIRESIQAEAQRMWGLTAPGEFERFRAAARKIKVVVDPNGGASGNDQYARLLRQMGLQVVEIPVELGRPQHLIEPVNDPLKGNGLAHAGAWLRAEYERDQTAGNVAQAYLAIVTDYDSDRANLVILDPATGRILEPAPQEVVALNVSMALAWAQHVRQQTGDTRPLAIVVHDATSRRIWEIAKAFGAEVFVVEVGEVNVLEKMRALERQGYHVVIGVEGANGGTIFRGESVEFLGDTCRNGAMTGLFTAMLVARPVIGEIWSQKLQAVLGTSAVIHQPKTLVELLESLPGERGTGAWKFSTDLWVLGRPGDIPKTLAVGFAQALEQRFYETVWPQLNNHYFAGFRIVHHQGVRESTRFEAGERDASRADLAEHGMGGWTLELDNHSDLNGASQALIWFRISATEGMLRAEVEGQGDHAELIMDELRALVEKEWYPQALRMARGAAGLEEGALGQAVRLETVPVVSPKGSPSTYSADSTVLVSAVAGKGTRFLESGGQELKVLANVGGVPAAARSMLAALELGWSGVYIVGYKGDLVRDTLQRTLDGRGGSDRISYVTSENPTGGTGYALYHAAAVPGLHESKALIVATMGDQPLYDRKVLEDVANRYRAGGVDLVIATAIFDDPTGKGRVVRDGDGKILGILEQKDIERGVTLGGYSRDELLAIREGNISIYAMPANRFFDELAATTNNNAQQQYYVTDIVKRLLDAGGVVEAVQIDPAKAPDITTREDLDQVEAYLAQQGAGTSSSAPATFTDTSGVVAETGSSAWRTALRQPREQLAGKVVVLTPETALPGVIQGLAALQQEPGSVFVVALARNATDAEQIQRELNAAKLWIRLPVINVRDDYAGQLNAAIQYVQRQVGTSLTILRSLEDLREVGLFLGLPAALSASWADWVRQQQQASVGLETSL